MLQMLYSRSQKCGKHLVFNFSQQLKWCGLSLLGINYLHQQLLAPSVETFRTLVTNSIEQYKSEVISAANKYCGIFWLDNFSRFLKFSSLRKSPYGNCNWTAFAIKLSQIELIQFTTPIPYKGIEQLSFEILKFVATNTLSQIAQYKSAITEVLYSPPLVETPT